MLNNIADIIAQPLRDFGALWSNVQTIISSNYNTLFGQAKNINSLYVAEESQFPSELAYMLGAYTTPQDTIATIRLKARNAPKLHKQYTNFAAVWKPIIDSITGGNSSIYTGSILYGSFVVGTSRVGTPSKLGFVSFANSVSQAQQPGEIFINLGLNPSAQQQLALQAELGPLAPVFYNVYIGNVVTISSAKFLVGSSKVGSTDEIGVSLGNVNNFITYMRLS